MPTQINYLDYEKSEALKKEMDVFQQKYGALTLSESDYLSKYPTAKSFIKEFMSRVEELELQRQIERFSNSCKILDVGVGEGQSSIYLASKGHIVSVAEPSPDLCRFIEFIANLYNLPLRIYNCSAEVIDQINESFDVIIFNSIFHHCDDPLKVLHNCYHSLKEEGKLLLINEPILQFYKTKKWFYTRLETNPEDMGHYGGNEHIYRHHEYMKMLKSVGFSKIISEPSVYINDYKLCFQQAKMKIINGKPLFNPRILVMKKIYYYCIDKIINRGLLGKQILELLKYMSILQTTFIVSK